MPATLTKNGDTLELDLSSCRGTEFADTLAKIREVPGRKYDGDRKLWLAPADGSTAEQIMSMIRPDASPELHAWIKEQRVAETAELTTPLPDDAELEIPLGDKLYPFQRAFVDHAAERQRLVLADDMGLGKLQSMDSRILTPTGWTTFRDIEPGDAIIGRDGGTHRIVDKYPQGRKDLYRVTLSDGTSTLAGAEHLWAVKSPTDVARGGDWRVLTTEQLGDAKDAAGNRRWRVPLVEPVDFAERPTPALEPYYMGVLLGDGSFRGTATPHISNHHDDVEIIESCQELTTDAIRKPPSSKYDWSVVGGATKRALESYGLWGHLTTEKRIPDDYLYGSVETRLAVLQGLMDTDGYLQSGSRTSAEIAVSCEALADGIVHLVQSLGGTARRRIKPTTHADSHRITVRLPPQFAPFRLRRKADLYQARTKYGVIRAIESIEYEQAAEACCIRVSAPDALYVTDDFIVTHNTVQALGTVAEYTARDGVDGPKLIVAPNSVKGAWKREIFKWLDPSEDVFVVEGTPAKREEAIRSAIAVDGWAIVNWEQLRVERKRLKTRNGGERTVTQMKQPLFETTPWLAVIADEAHRAKNRKASQSMGLHRIDANLMIAATGTPIMNSPDELWSLLKWMWPKEYTSYWRFYDQYVEYHESYYGKVITGVKNPDALRFELRDRLVRRTKDQVLDLPEKIRVTIPVELSKEQRALYVKAEKDMWLAVVKEAEEGSPTAKAMLKAGQSSDVTTMYRIPNGAARMVRQRQILESPALLEGKDDSAKLDACVERILDAVEHQHVVFCEFVETTAILAERLRAKGLEVATYTGSVKPEERTAIEDAFQNGEYSVIVGTIAAMKEGITLTAADVEHFISRSWVPATNEQAEDRCHRVGQDRPVVINIYEAENTVDTLKVAPTNDLKDRIVRAVLPKDNVKEERNGT